MSASSMHQSSSISTAPVAPVRPRINFARFPEFIKKWTVYANTCLADEVNTAPVRRRRINFAMFPEYIKKWEAYATKHLNGVVYTGPVVRTAPMASSSNKTRTIMREAAGHYLMDIRRRTWGSTDVVEDVPSHVPSPGLMDDPASAAMFAGIEKQRQDWRSSGLRGFHHFNWLGNPVACKNATPPAVSFVAMFSQPKRDAACGDHDLHKHVLLSNAFHHVDPLVFAGESQLLPLIDQKQVGMVLKGTRLQEAVTGYVHKAYSSIGRWTKGTSCEAEYYQEDDTEAGLFAEDHEEEYTDEDDIPCVDPMKISAYPPHLTPLNGWYGVSGAPQRHQHLIQSRQLCAGLHHASNHAVATQDPRLALFLQRKVVPGNISQLARSCRVPSPLRMVNTNTQATVSSSKGNALKIETSSTVSAVPAILANISISQHVPTMTQEDVDAHDEDLFRFITPCNSPLQTSPSSTPTTPTSEYCDQLVKGDNSSAATEVEDDNKDDAAYEDVLSSSNDVLESEDRSAATLEVFEDESTGEVAAIWRRRSSLTTYDALPQQEAAVIEATAAADQRMLSNVIEQPEFEADEMDAGVEAVTEPAPQSRPTTPMSILTCTTLVEPNTPALDSYEATVADTPNRSRRRPSLSVPGTDSVMFERLLGPRFGEGLAANLTQRQLEKYFRDSEATPTPEQQVRLNVQTPGYREYGYRDLAAIARGGRREIPALRQERARIEEVEHRAEALPSSAALQLICEVAENEGPAPTVAETATNQLAPVIEEAEDQSQTPVAQETESLMQTAIDARFETSQNTRIIMKKRSISRLTANVIDQHQQELDQIALYFEPIPEESENGEEVLPSQTVAMEPSNAVTEGPNSSPVRISPLSPPLSPFQRPNGLTPNAVRHVGGFFSALSESEVSTTSSPPSPYPGFSLAGHKNLRAPPLWRLFPTNSQRGRQPQLSHHQTLQAGTSSTTTYGEPCPALPCFVRTRPTALQSSMQALKVKLHLPTSADKQKQKKADVVVKERKKQQKQWVEVQQEEQSKKTVIKGIKEFFRRKMNALRCKEHTRNTLLA